MPSCDVLCRGQPTVAAHLYLFREPPIHPPLCSLVPPTFTRSPWYLPSPLLRPLAPSRPRCRDREPLTSRRGRPTSLPPVRPTCLTRRRPAKRKMESARQPGVPALATGCRGSARACVPRQRRTRPRSAVAGQPWAEAKQPRLFCTPLSRRRLLGIALQPEGVPLSKPSVRSRACAHSTSSATGKRRDALHLRFLPLQRVGIIAIPCSTK